MSENSVKERVARNEERIKTLFSGQERIEEEIKDMRTAIQHFANEQYHDLMGKIKDAKRMRRAPWGAKEWLAIITTIILTLGNIVMKIIEMGGGL